MRRRVKITGLGPVTPAGIGRAAFFKGINEPISRVGLVTRFEDPSRKAVAAEVLNFKVSDWVKAEERTSRLPRHTQFAMAGTQLALDDAGITADDLKQANPVIVNGSSLMDVELTYRTVRGVAERGPSAAKPSVIFEAPPIAVAGHIASLLGASHSRIIAVQSACCSGLDAIAHGMEMVASGQADFAVCCGTEAPIYYQPMLEMGIVRLSPQNGASPQEMGRPFDLWRITGVIGVGAGVVILEPEESPREGYAWIAGYAYAADNESEESGGGLLRTMDMALKNAKRQPEEVDLINAWGPGHPTVDRVEARCLRRCFGERASDIPAVSIKGGIGNPLGAAGAIQVISAALSLKLGKIPPTVNWKTRDPDCRLNLSASARYLPCRVALVNAHGISGSNGSLVLEAMR